MADKAAAVAEAASALEDAAQAGLFSQLGMMASAFWNSPTRKKLVLLSVAIFLVIVATAYGQIKLNEWNQPFFDALSRRDLPEFFAQLLRFGVIAGGLLVLNVAQMWLNQTTKVKLREGLVHDLVGQWLEPGRAFRLANAGTIGVNPDQRLHEDARHLTELSTDLGIGLLQASILLFSFVSVLWALSSGFVFHIAGRTFAIPGYMVWAAVFYAGSASLLSYFVGRKLIGLNSERYAREADLRYGLMRVNEHVDAIALAAGETDEKRRIEIDLQAVLTAMRRLVWGLTNLTWITAGYGWFTLVAPILVAAPVYFSGNLSFGGLMVAVGAFNQVHSSLRWFVDNFSQIADWRATLLRVAGFRRAAIITDTMHDSASRIAFADGQAGIFRIEKLEIIAPSGCTRLSETDAVLKAGEKAAIVGEPGTGKTLLFRALAGLWPWGSGEIVRPKGETIHYMPRTPYLPPGSLREVLAYPSAVTTFDDTAYIAALKRVGLETFEAMLDTSKRWDHDLTEDEQQSLAFARLTLHRPAWALIDEVLDSVADETHERFVDILGTDLKDTGVLHIGKSNEHDHLFGTVLHLVKEPEPALPRAAKPA